MTKLAIITVILVIAAVSVIVFNQLSMSGLATTISGMGTSTNAAKTITASATTSGPDMPGIFPKGVPEIYGKELDIKYDDVSASNPQLADMALKKLGYFDTRITLTGEKLQRYKNIGLQISCEYCCGVDSIILPDGRAACGCAHSFAMRGLAKYLLDKHDNEYTDDQILEELGKWKVLSFPSALQKKAAVLQSKGIELNYINLASNKYRGIEN